MDTLLAEGDYKRDRRGFPIPVFGAEERFQQAYIRLTVPQGQFALDKELGSRLYTMGQANPQKVQELALEYAREALMGMEDIRVISAEVVLQQDQILKIVFLLEYTGDKTSKQMKMMWEFNC